jgi:hypothetical protein
MLNKQLSKILQKGDTGFGILIESDAGYINYDTNKDILNEAFELKPNEPVLINCILQKWGVKNKNGRIYPKDVLLSQANLYQDLVNTNSAVSEADHPDCVNASESMICTKDGWKSFDEISDDEEILTLNTTTNKIEIQRIEKKIYEPYKGKMYKFKNKNTLELTVTPNHRFLVEDSKGDKKYYFAKEIYDDKNGVLSNGKNKLLKTAEWNGEYNDFFTLKGIDLNDLVVRKKDLREKYSSDIQIKSQDWFAFLGIYLADGHSCGTISGKEKSRGYNVVITQKKPKTQIAIEELLDKLPFEYYIIEYVDGKKQYHIHDARLYKYLSVLGSSATKYIPTEIKQANKELLEILFKWFMIGDGRSVISKNPTWSKKESVFSTSKKLIYDLKEILLKIGGSGDITKYQPKDRIFAGRLIKAENSQLLYNLNIAKTKHIYLDKRNVEITEIDFDDYIGCVRVPNGNFYVMVNGKSHWTGNSSIISLQNISHMITKMWWGKGQQENVLFGQLKLIVSPGFIKYGVVSVIGDKIVLYLQNKIRLGISSRGVGTLKEINGENLVQDDFELIGFDLVATPSTPGAFLFPEKNVNISFGENYVNKNSVLIKEDDNKIIKAINKFIL